MRKSTIIEKLAGPNIKNRSSNADESFTLKTEYFETPDGKLLIADIPGSNAMDDTLGHNIQIATAFNFGLPVSRILIVVKADTRIDITVDHASKYAEQLIDLDPDAFAVVVTHMDLVTWDQRRFSDAINRKLGMDAVVYTQPDTTSSVLQ